MSRSMTRRLEAAIESLTATQREVVITVIDKMAHNGGGFDRLLAGLRAEMRAADQREADVMAALADDRRTWLDDVDRRVHGDPAPVEGVANWPNVDGPDDGSMT
jgi:hypothetical protein